MLWARHPYPTSTLWHQLDVRRVEVRVTDVKKSMLVVFVDNLFSAKMSMKIIHHYIFSIVTEFSN